jgi:hypothetical protein
MNTVCKVGISISDFYNNARYVFIMPDLCTSRMRKIRGTWGGGADGTCYDAEQYSTVWLGGGGEAHVLMHDVVQRCIRGSASAIRFEWDLDLS